MRWAWHVACKRARMNAYRILMGKPEGKRQPARLRCRWDYGIKIDLREIGCRIGVWTGLIWLRIWTSGGLL
jgi:hypothetical protein